MTAQRIPGLALGVGRGGRVIYARGYGQCELAEGRPTNEATSFTIASISKQFTAATIMRLEERGEVELDDPLTRYFPDLPYPGVRIRHLLTHTSGIPGFTEAPGFERRCRTRVTPAEIVATVSQRPPAFAPQTEWQYSNTNYILLGRLIERITEERYADGLRRAILEPLGLLRTGVVDLTTIRANAARGYLAYALGEHEQAVDRDPSWELGTGDLFSTVGDLIRWNVALRRGEVVHPSSYERMASSATLADGRPTGYGYGLSTQQFGGLREVRHTGGLPGYSLDNSTYPELDLDVVVLANLESISTYASIVRPVLALLLEQPDLAVVARSTTARPVQARTLSLRPEHWIGAVRDGRVNELPLHDDFVWFLEPRRRAALQRLSRLGPLGAVEPLDTARRDPVTTFTYRAHFEQQTVIASITMFDDDTIGHVGFREWDRP